MTLDPHALKIYVDGSSFKNPGGASGFAGRAEYPESWNRKDEVLFTVGYESSTNNRMELLACITAMEHIRDNVLGVQRVQIVTDSRYVHDNVPRAEGWRRNDWKNLHGRPIENDDLWRRFLSVRRKLRVRTDFVRVKGKKSPILKAIDSDAKAAAHQPSECDFGFKEGKVGRSKVKGTRTSAALFPASGQEAIIHIYRTNMVKKVDKIDFDLYAEQNREFAGKFRAYAEGTIGADLHRGHIYRVCFNNDPHYPKIECIVGEVPKEEFLVLSHRTQQG
jgi:ribonuclease HI